MGLRLPKYSLQPPQSIGVERTEATLEPRERCAWNAGLDGENLKRKTSPQAAKPKVSEFREKSPLGLLRYAHTLNS